jgi:hypothetical protein
MNNISKQTGKNIIYADYRNYKNSIKLNTKNHDLTDKIKRYIDMIFSTELANKIETVSGSKYLEAGIHDDVKLVSARTAVSMNGNNFLEIKFEKDGKELTHTEWEPSRGSMDEEAFAKKCDTQFKRMEQILKCFTNEQLTFVGASFKELCEWVQSHLNKADLNTLLRVKVVYNTNGYTSLPKYAAFTFIEPMTVVNEGKSMITKLGIDLFEKPIVADTEKSNPNPFTVGTTVEPEDPNQLPF